MSTVRYRQNIDCLTTNQLHDLREAYQGLYDLPEDDPRSYATIAGLHGLPSPSYCAHGSPGFLTWHRAYLKAFERALQCMRSNVMLPFWDWSSGPSTGVPDACSQPTYINRDGDEVPNPLYSGPIATAAGGGQTSRRSDIDSVAFDDIGATARTALSSTTFSGFQNALNGPHGSIHVRIGSHMSAVARAGFDPIFWLHHCNVDRLWRQWQLAHPGALPANEANLDLIPFNKPYSNEWQRGSDVESTDDLGYRYANLCLIIPPIRIWDVAVLKPLPPWILERLTSARLIFRSSRMQHRSMMVHVFINDREASERTKTMENPHFAGSFGLFGMGHHGEQMEMIEREERFDLELDITETLQQMARGGDELAFKLIAVDPDGEPVRPEEVDVSGFELLLD